MKSSKNIWNILSTYGNKLWGFISIFIFIPLYIKYLGMESYAVIGFYSLLLGIISFADAGLSSAITREFASEHTNNYKYSVLRLIEKLYLTICVSVVILIFLFAPLISKYWLTSEKISIDLLTYYIRLIGLGVSIQLISSLYYGAMFGIDHQVEANIYQVTWSISRSLGVLLVLIWVSKTLEMYFLWQIICNSIYVLLLRSKLVQVLKINVNKLYIEIQKIPKEILVYVGGMSIVAIISSINSQIDKIVVSSAFPLKTYGYYSLASALSQLPVMLGVPLVLSLFPKFSNLAVRNETDKLRINFEKFNSILNVFIFTILFILLLYPSEILNLWTKNAVESNYQLEVLRTIQFLSIGSTFLALQLLFFYILLSYGQTKYTIYQGFVQISFGVPLLYLFVNKIGLSGAGISWVIINFGAFVYLFIVVSKKYLHFKYLRFFISSILTPFLMVLFPILLGFLLYKRFNEYFLIIAIISATLSLAINLLLFSYKYNKSFKNIFSLFNFLE